MWHASVAPDPPGLSVPDRVLRDRAHAALDGVGDPTAGQWEERGDVAWHLRRRLTATEQHAARIDQVVDVRGTWEAPQAPGPGRPMATGRMGRVTA